MDATVRAPGPVLVGVDGSTQNTSAVAWAAAEVASSGGTLPLVLVHDVGGSGQAVGRAIVDRASAAAERLAPDVRPEREVVRGGAGHSLRRTTQRWTPEGKGSGTPILVVGRRGRGAGRRVRLGTIPRQLVSRPGPVTIVVPEGWSAGQVADDAPVVVDVGDVLAGDDAAGAGGAGVGPSGTAQPGAAQPGAAPALAMTLARALRLDRRVVAVASWAVPAGAFGADRAIREVWDDYAARAERALEALLVPWRTAYPTVELLAVPTDRHPVSAVLDHTDDAELLVVPRGDRASALVEYAECPVAVV